MLLGASKVRYVPMGISIPFPFHNRLVAEKSIARSKVAKLLGLPTDKPLILYVGRLGKEKNLGILLRAIRESRSSLIVAGDGPLRQRMKNNPNTIPLGFVFGKRLSELYLAADLFVSPSITETLGRTSLESLAHGTPILVPNRGYHNTVLPTASPAVHTYEWSSTDDGFQNMRDTLEEILGQGDSFTSKCEEALAIAMDFSWERVLPYHIEPYREILDGSGVANE
jgi:alpha-1,6-mannosyltransferase